MSQTNESKSLQNVSVRYDKTEIVYATQFLASPSSEELMLDFSSGVISDPEGEGDSLHIHTRLAMPWSAVERLTKILNKVVDRREQLLDGKQQIPSTSPGVKVPVVPQASLPQMSSQTRQPQ